MIVFLFFFSVFYFSSFFRLTSFSFFFLRLSHSLFRLLGPRDDLDLLLGQVAATLNSIFAAF